jgi:Xaa-Pro aminopeptidase
MIERIQELRLEHGTIGMADGSLSHRFYAQLASALPNAKVVDVSDIFLNLRTIKSDEEIAMIDQANRVFDAAIDGVYEAARPGMVGKTVTQEGIRAMWKVGGDLDSTFGINFGAVPKQNPILVHLCMDRPIQAGDIGTLTAHAEYGHYAGHSDQEISFGEPSALHKEMFAAVLHAREAVLKTVRSGVTQRDLIDAYQQACRETGFKSSPHSQIHQYGIDVPEFPGPAFAAPDPKESGRGGGRNFVLRPGMIYSISPTIVAPSGEDTLLGGTSLVVTEDGYRELGNRQVEMLVVR